MHYIIICKIKMGKSKGCSIRRETENISDTINDVDLTGTRRTTEVRIDGRQIVGAIDAMLHGGNNDRNISQATSDTASMIKSMTATSDVVDSGIQVAGDIVDARADFKSGMDPRIIGAKLVAKNLTGTYSNNSENLSSSIEADIVHQRSVNDTVTNVSLCNGNLYDSNYREELDIRETKTGGYDIECNGLKASRVCQIKRLKKVAGCFGLFTSETAEDEILYANLLDKYSDQICNFKSTINGKSHIAATVYKTTNGFEIDIRDRDKCYFLKTADESTRSFGFLSIPGQKLQSIRAMVHSSTLN